MDTNPITNRKLHASYNPCVCRSIRSVGLIYKQGLYVVF